MKYFVCVFFLALVVATLGQSFGGWSKLEESRAQELAKKSTEHLNKRLNSNNYVRHIDILLAESQVVAGFNYRLEFTAGYTKCTKQTHKLGEYHNCELLEGKKPVKCTAKILDAIKKEDSKIDVNCPGL